MTLRVWLPLAAAVLSLPTFLLTAGASASIAWGIATDAGYRDLFLGYGLRMLALEGACAAGLASAAWIASGRAASTSPRARALVQAVAIAGFIAAIVLDVQFWPDADPWLPRGLFVVPYLVWIACAAILRRDDATR